MTLLDFWKEQTQTRDWSLRWDVTIQLASQCWIVLVGRHSPQKRNDECQLMMNLPQMTNIIVLLSCSK